MVYRSSSLWLGIKQFYSTIIDYTSWTVGTSSFINFWNDKWCGTTSLANIVGLSDGVNIPDIVSQFWTGGDWNIPLSWQQMPHLFSHIMVRAEQDIPNWILDESGCFTLKSTITFFLDPGVPCSWGKFIWSSYLLSSKLLPFGKFLKINIFKIKVCIFVLCVRFVKSTRNLFNIYFLNVMMLCLFEVGFDRFFLLLISLKRMISSLLLIVMVVIWLNWLSL